MGNFTSCSTYIVASKAFIECFAINSFQTQFRPRIMRCKYHKYFSPSPSLRFIVWWKKNLTRDETSLCHSEGVNCWERNLKQRELVICVLRPACPLLKIIICTNQAYSWDIVQEHSTGDSLNYVTCRNTGMPVTVATSRFTWPTVCRPGNVKLYIWEGKTSGLMAFQSISTLPPSCSSIIVSL